VRAESQAPSPARQNDMRHAPASDAELAPSRRATRQRHRTLHAGDQIDRSKMSSAVAARVTHERVSVALQGGRPLVGTQRGCVTGSDDFANLAAGACSVAGARFGARVRPAEVLEALRHRGRCVGSELPARHRFSVGGRARVRASLEQSHATEGVLGGLRASAASLRSE
jgi:hypothetical protein